MGYLVTLGKVRAITAREILAKYRDLSLGADSINVPRFIERRNAITAGAVAGAKAAAAAKDDGWPGIVQTTRAAAAAAAAAAAVKVIHAFVDMRRTPYTHDL
jgi:hypothetical protein